MKALVSVLFYSFFDTNFSFAAILCRNNVHSTIKNLQVETNLAICLLIPSMKELNLAPHTAYSLVTVTWDFITRIM